jgi:hypothetical protein
MIWRFYDLNNKEAGLSCYLRGSWCLYVFSVRKICENQFHPRLLPTSREGGQVCASVCKCFDRAFWCLGALVAS